MSILDDGTWEVFALLEPEALRARADKLAGELLANGVGWYLTGPEVTA